MKAILTIDMPKTCYDCPLAMRQYETLAPSNKREKFTFACVLTHKTTAITKRSRFCPLKEMPMIEAIPISWIDKYTGRTYAYDDNPIDKMIDDWRAENDID